MSGVFFIPVFNQIHEFPQVLAQLKAEKLPFDILLFNNGSNDGSEKLVRESGLPFLEVEKNRGLGYSYMLAMEWALERKYDFFGSMAANGKMLPTEMSRITDPLINHQADYVTGSRFLIGGASPNLPKFRQSTIPMVNFYVRLLYGIALTDATCGYRAFRLDLIRQAKFDWHQPWQYTYGLEYYLYAKFLLNKSLRCREVPITMKYPQKGQRYSKIRPFVDWWQMLKPWLIARIDGQGFAGENKAYGR